jgi:transcription antitermination factor NusG
VPVLDKEPITWPTDLFNASVESRFPDQWCVFHVRPRSEKAFARYLRSREIGYFLPQMECRKRYQRRLVRSHIVLFPSYIFVLINEQSRIPALASKDVIRTLAIDDQERIERELQDIYRLIESGQSLTREERLQPGSMARIVHGPLAGLCGQVVTNKKGQKFVLQVQFLQQGVSIDIDVSLIEAI